VLIKRILDFCISLIGVIFLIPLTIVLKIVFICFGDFHSIFYIQKRIGKNGKEFNFIKYRTMVKNADVKLEQILSENEELAKEYKENRKLKNDPRLTKVGRFLRKTNIDELPQLWLVLIGKMSLVGNRPYMVSEKADMGKYFDDIVKTKPGITGYWQVMRNRYGRSFETRLFMESFYSNNRTLKLDFILFFKTIKMIFRGQIVE